MYDVGRLHRIDKQISRINRFQNDVECAAFSRKLVAKILLNGYLTIWHPRPAKYAPFCIMYNKSTYQSIAFVHFHVYRINVLHVLYCVLFSKNPIFFLFFFFLRFSKKKKTLPHLYHRRTVEIDLRKKIQDFFSL